MFLRRPPTPEELLRKKPKSTVWVTEPQTKAYIVPHPIVYSGRGNIFEHRSVVVRYPSTLPLLKPKLFIGSEVYANIFTNLGWPVIDLRPPKPYRTVKAMAIEEVLV